ncbi:MAG: hypothetical protein QM715_03915 [Nibricoccus sp.]
MPIKDVVQIAREAAFTLPDETRQSFPIPILSPTGSKIVFLFCPQHVMPGEGALLSPPSYSLEYDWIAKTTGGLRKITNAGDIGGGSFPAGSQALHKMPFGKTLDDCDKMGEELDRLYDELIPIYFKQVEPTADLPKKCKSFLTIFSEISEKPLASLYATVGKSYFDWLHENAKKCPISIGDIDLAEMTALAWVSIQDRVYFEGTRQMLPIPVLKNKEVVLAIVYYGSMDRPGSSTLSHPRWLQTIEYPSGKMIDLRPTNPEDFGLHAWRDPIGQLTMPAGMTANEFSLNKRKLLETMAKLLPAFRAWNNRTAADRQNVKRFKELFEKISEPPLKPYYEAIGYNWFQWLKQ